MLGNAVIGIFPQAANASYVNKALNRGRPIPDSETEKEYLLRNMSGEEGKE